MSLAIAFQIFHSVIQVDTALLEKAVYFHACLKAEKPAELGGGAFVFTVGFQRNRFKRCTGEVRNWNTQGRGQFVGNSDGNLFHDVSIREACWRQGLLTQMISFELAAL